MTACHFALIPAAGHSTRMREPKLLLPLAGQPLILHTIAAWQRSRVDCVVVVIRPGDEALTQLVRTAGVEIVIPDSPPPDMKASLRAALRHIEQEFAPTTNDAFLVAPADMPQLSAGIINRLIAEHRADSGQKILAPTLSGRQGHPVLFPWPLAKEVDALGPDEGLNAIVHRHPPVLVACEDLVAANEYPFADIDTPEDFQQMTNDK
jgi:molybdenum cofactor cytidylyltransferase